MLEILGVKEIAPGLDAAETINESYQESALRAWSCSASA
jgi:hypothetical protein